MFSPLVNAFIVFLVTFFLAYAVDAFLRLKEVKGFSEISFREFFSVYWRRIPIPGIHLTPDTHFASWVFGSVEYTNKGFVHNCSECHRKRYLTELEEKKVNF